MPTLTNIGLISGLKQLIPDYIRSYLVANGAGASMFSVDAVNLNQWSGSPKSLINVYDWRIEDSPQDSGICRERQSIYFSVVIRNMEQVGAEFNLQADYIRAIFAGKGATLNTFSGKLNGSSFTNQRLSAFGLFNFRVTSMREVYAANDSYFIFGVTCQIQFKNQFIALS